MANSYSSLKIFHHKKVLDAIGNNEHQAPIYIRLKPTNICNQHCAYCTYGSGATVNKTENRDNISHSDIIPWKKLEEILDDIGCMGVKAITFSGGGEPLTYPNICDAVRKVKEYNMDYSLISNGQLLSGDIAKEFYDAKWIRISFDFAEASGYMNLRNVTEKAYNAVCNNIETFANNKNADCVLGINYVISRANANNVYESARFLKKLGVDNVKYAAVVSDEEGYHKSIKDSVIEQIHKAKDKFESEDFKIINNYENDWMDKNFTEQPFDKCYTCRFITVIGADQCVYLCHTRAYDSNAIVGDLHNMSFREMWYSQNTVDKFLGLIPKKDCMNFCAYQDRNMLINAYYDTDRNHINFI